MPLSGYQVEAFLNAFRKRYGYQRTLPHSVENLNISADARTEMRAWGSQSHQTSLKEWVTPQNVLAIIADQTPYDPVIEYEQQRRAGLFFNPPYMPANAPPAIGLVRDFEGAFEITESEESEEVKTPSEETNDGSGMNGKSAVSETDDLNVGEAKDVTFEVEGNQKAETEPISVEETQETVGGSSVNEAKKLLDTSNVKETLDKLLEEEEIIEEDETGETEEETEADVVYGTGHVTDAAVINFVQSYPDSALKFLFQADLEGKPLSTEITELYQGWKERGLSRKKLRLYIKTFMDWEQFPDIPLSEMLPQMQDKIYDLQH